MIFRVIYFAASRKKHGIKSFIITSTLLVYDDQVYASKVQQAPVPNTTCTEISQPKLSYSYRLCIGAWHTETRRSIVE